MSFTSLVNGHYNPTPKAPQARVPSQLKLENIKARLVEKQYNENYAKRVKTNFLSFDNPLDASIPIEMDDPLFALFNPINKNVSLAFSVFDGLAVNRDVIGSDMQFDENLIFTGVASYYRDDKTNANTEISTAENGTLTAINLSRKSIPFGARVRLQVPDITDKQKQQALKSRFVEAMFRPQLKAIWTPVGCKDIQELFDKCVGLIGCKNYPLDIENYEEFEYRQQPYLKAAVSYMSTALLKSVIAVCAFLHLTGFMEDIKTNLTKSGLNIGDVSKAPQRDFEPASFNKTDFDATENAIKVFLESILDEAHPDLYEVSDYGQAFLKAVTEAFGDDCTFYDKNHALSESLSYDAHALLIGKTEGHPFWKDFANFARVYDIYASKILGVCHTNASEANERLDILLRRKQ